MILPTPIKNGQPQQRGSRKSRHQSLEDTDDCSKSRPVTYDALRKRKGFPQTPISQLQKATRHTFSPRSIHLFTATHPFADDKRGLRGRRKRGKKSREYQFSDDGWKSSRFRTECLNCMGQQVPSFMAQPFFFIIQWCHIQFLYILYLMRIYCSGSSISFVFCFGQICWKFCWISWSTSR